MPFLRRPSMNPLLLAAALLGGLGELLLLQAWRLRDRLGRGPAGRG